MSDSKPPWQLEDVVKFRCQCGKDVLVVIGDKGLVLAFHRALDLSYGDKAQDYTCGFSGTRPFLDPTLVEAVMTDTATNPQWEYADE